MRCILSFYLVVLALLLPQQSWAARAAAEYWVPVKCQSGIVFAESDMPDYLADATVQSYIKEYTVLGRKETSAMLERATRYFPLFEAHLSQAGLPEGLKYMPMVESNLREEVTSYAGAAGLWQFMPATARFYGLTVNDTLDERTDPELATQAAVQFLTYLNRQFCDWRLVLAAYNCGPGKVRRLLRQADVDHFESIEHQLPEQTQQYIRKFIAATYVANNFQELGLEPFASAKKEEQASPLIPRRTEQTISRSAPEPFVVQASPSIWWSTVSSVQWSNLIGRAAETLHRTVLPLMETTKPDLLKRQPQKAPVSSTPPSPGTPRDKQTESYAVFRRTLVW